MATAEQTVSAVLESTNKRYVVETGNNENGWFTRYSDGWVEQGGNLGYGNMSTPDTNTISFPVAFTEIPTILIGGMGYKGIQTYEGGIDAESVSTTGFTYFGIANGQYHTNTFNWEAKGFAA